MPRFDKYHEIVKTALIKDGWKIVYDPFLLKYKGLRLYIDLGAEKNLGENKAAVEIKVFGSGSFVNDFEKAIGQCVLYTFVLKKADFEHKLYLAITKKVFEKFSEKPAILEFLIETKISLIVFDSEKEEILQWINQENTEKY